MKTKVRTFSLLLCHAETPGAFQMLPAPPTVIVRVCLSVAHRDKKTINCCCSDTCSLTASPSCEFQLVAPPAAPRPQTQAGGEGHVRPSARASVRCTRRDAAEVLTRLYMVNHTRLHISTSWCFHGSWSFKSHVTKTVFLSDSVFDIVFSP